jgi:hypothetical protein
MIPAKTPAPIVRPAPISLSRLLFVEGDTPTHFFEALLCHLGIDKHVEIRNFRSITQLRPSLIDLARTVQFQTLVRSVGVIRDAETDAVAARRSVDDALQAAGLTPTRVPPIATSVFILPDNAAQGMIETLCMHAVDGEATLAATSSCTKEFFDCLWRAGVTLAPEPRLSKNRAQVYLATHIDVQLFPGQAAYRGHWPWNNPVFGPLKQFLQNL